MLRLGANRLLNRAKLSLWRVDVTEDGTGQLLPTVTGFAAKQAISALRKHNIATAPLLQRAGLSERDFAAATVIPCTIAYPQSRRLSSSTTPQRRWTTAPSGFT